MIVNNYYHFLQARSDVLFRAGRSIIIGAIKGLNEQQQLSYLYFQLYYIFNFAVNTYGIIYNNILYVCVYIHLILSI